VDRQLRFNVPHCHSARGQACHAGAGSAYVHRLKPGDHRFSIVLSAIFTSSRLKTKWSTIGGGAGMAPLRSHLSSLLETQKSTRRIQFLVRCAIVAGGVLPGLF